MKLYRSILLILPLLVLSSCGSDDPKKPVTPSSTSQSTSVAPTSSSVENPFKRFLTLEEQIETFLTAESALKDITKSTVKDSYVERVYSEESKTLLTSSEYHLDEVSTKYTNSVVFSSYTPSNLSKEDEYIYFDKYDIQYGPHIEQYISFKGEKWETLNTVNVYKPIGGSKKNVVISEKSTSLLADSKFNLYDSAKFGLIDPSENQNYITAFAEDSKGYFIIEWTYEQSSLGEGNIVYNSSIHKYYKFLNGQLLFQTFQNINQEIDNESKIVNRETVLTYSADFLYSSNGEFDTSKIPEAN